MRKLTVLLACSLLLSIVSLAQNNNIQKQKFHFGREQDTTAGYAQAVKVDNVLYISGTVARGDAATALKGIYTQLERTLKQYGATFQNVVKETLFTTDIEAVKQANHVRKPFYKGDFPAATWVQISRLYMAEVIIEVELIAHLPK
ncbi:MAG TPA: RidA family protein [Chitinophagaceae bacterium]|nr:RidA family protein [Chitinophagaceae bacterium]